MKIIIHTVFNIETLFTESFTDTLKKSDIVVLPEMFLGGYAVFKQDKKFCIPENHEILINLKALSKIKKITIVSGSLPIGNSRSERKNTSLTFHKGKLIHRYDKIHLFKPLKEDKLFKPGKEYSNFEITIDSKIVRCGVIICYDLRFPEFTRLKACKGLDILFVPAWWPKERDEIWYTLLKARAIENQIFVIGVNSEFDEKCGNSYGFAPNGNLLLSTKSGKKKNFYTLKINLNEISKIKKFVNSFKDAKLLEHLCG
jgi:predicted amidohydrolase